MGFKAIGANGCLRCWFRCTSVPWQGVSVCFRIPFLFQGLPEYRLSEAGVFELPVHWLIFHGFLLFLVGFYPVQELTYSGGQAFVRSGRREYWLLSKVLWVCFTVAGYYLMLAAVLAVCSLLAGDPGTWCEHRSLNRYWRFSPYCPILSPLYFGHPLRS